MPFTQHIEVPSHIFSGSLIQLSWLYYLSLPSLKPGKGFHDYIDHTGADPG